MAYLTVFQKLCGPIALQNVLLTTTQWSNVDPAEGKSSEDRLRNYYLWRGFIDKGATIKRFEGTRESGLELIDQLMKKEPKPLLIQDQMVKNNMALVETDVGRYINGN